MSPRGRNVAVLLAASAVTAALLASCGSSSRGGDANNTTATKAGTAGRHYPPYAALLPAARRHGSTAFVPAARWHGQTAAWIARASNGVTLLSFDQHTVELALHSGAVDAGAAGWTFGPSIAGGERRRVLAAFNGGFKFSTNAGGFKAGGRTAVPLRRGLGSVVTYTNGTTDIGAWQIELPAPRRTVASVRQNLPLLIDHGRVAATSGCQLCWGATLGGVADPARSALGITADGRLIWVGGEHLTIDALASSLLAVHVVRAVELDINPEWVAAYLFGHHRHRAEPTPIPVLAGAPGVPGSFLAPYPRDFFTVLARG